MDTLIPTGRGEKGTQPFLYGAELLSAGCFLSKKRNKILTDPCHLQSLPFPFKTTWLCRIAPVEGQGSGMAWIIASRESTTAPFLSGHKGLAGYPVPVDRQHLQT